MSKAAGKVAAILALMLAVAAVSAQFYVGYKILTKKEVPIHIEEVLLNQSAYAGRNILVEGYVVKIRANATTHVMQGQHAIGRQDINDSLVLDGEGNFEPYAAYIYTGRYRSVHATKAVVKGTPDGKGRLIVQKIGFKE